MLCRGSWVKLRRKRRGAVRPQMLSPSPWAAGHLGGGWCLSSGPGKSVMSPEQGWGELASAPSLQRWHWGTAHRGLGRRWVGARAKTPAQEEGDGSAAPSRSSRGISFRGNSSKKIEMSHG